MPYAMLNNDSPMPALFHTTQWSMVLAAADESGDALERLCRTYWRPLYGYARRAGHSEADAEDMVQGFISKMLEKQWLKAIREERGPFRSFLQMAFRRFMIDQYDRTRAAKRGGGQTPVVLDTVGAEDFYTRELATTDTPETAYERAWALEVFSRAREALRGECAAAGREEVYHALQTGEPHATLAERFNTTTNALASFAFRVRRRLQELIREEILQTVSSSTSLEDEVGSLLRALNQG